MGEALALILCFLPTVWEIWDDRKGETKKDKERDVVVAIVLYIGVMLVAWWLGTPPVKSISMMLGARVMFFDYVIHYILIRRGVIHGHWFTYVGKTSTFDKRIAKVNPWIKLLVRVVVFAAALVYFLTD